MPMQGRADCLLPQIVKQFDSSVGRRITIGNLDAQLGRGDSNDSRNDPEVTDSVDPE